MIAGLERKLEYLAEENRVHIAGLESRNQEVFRLKRQLIEAEGKWTVGLETQLGSIAKPLNANRSLIDHSMISEIERLKGLRV